MQNEATRGSDRVAVVSYDFWRTRFSGDPRAIGESLELDGKTYSLIGVAPPGCEFPEGIQIWMPISPGSPGLFPGIIDYQMMGRLKPNARMEEARTELDAVRQQWVARNPNSHPNSALKTVRIRDYLSKDLRPAVVTLLAVVALVLLIAGVNAINLLLADVAKRQGELSIRLALGASRAHLGRLLLIENLLLALCGGGLGLVSALASITAIRAISPPSLPFLRTVAIDGRVLGFAIVLSLLTGIVLGLAVLFRVTQRHPDQGIRGNVPYGGGTRTRYIGQFLSAAEVAMALTLLAGAGLLVKSFMLLESVDIGFNPRNVLTVTISLPDSKYPTAEKRETFYEDLIDGLRSNPRATSVAAVNYLPMSLGSAMLLPITVPGKEDAGSDDALMPLQMVVTPDYFRSMGIPVLSGRDFSNVDGDGSTPVVIVDKTVAERLWPSESPIGKRVNFPTDKSPREIVGVVRDIKNYGAERDSLPTIYVPFAQRSSWPLSSLVIRSESSPRPLIDLVRSQIHRLDPDLPMYDVKTMDEWAASSVAPRRFNMVMFGLLALLAFGLACVGIAGVTSYSVAARTREIGIRVALGASRARVLGLILRQSMTPVLIGALAGLLAFLWISRFIAGLLYQVGPTDHQTFLVVSAALLSVAVIACYLPARTAVATDPVSALRCD